MLEVSCAFVINVQLIAKKINRSFFMFVIFSINTMHEKEGGVKVLSSLRRHYPDQVCGYFLSNRVN